MSDIWVVVWEVDYEGQSVCGAYSTQEEAEARIAVLSKERDQSYEGIGWIRCQDGEPVEAQDVGLWMTWNVIHESPWLLSIKQARSSSGKES